MFSKSYGKGRIFTKVTNIRVDFVSDTFNDLSFFYAQLASSVSHGIFFSLARFCYVRNARVKSDIYLWCKRNFLIAYLQKKVREDYLDFRI